MSKSIAWIVVDCLRYDYRQPFDDIYGPSYDNWFSVAHCSDPNYASMYTGLPPSEHGVYCNFGSHYAMPTQRELYQEQLLAVGYRTMATNIARAPIFHRRGFEFVLFVSTGGQCLYTVSLMSIRHFVERPGPVFVFLRLMDVHRPLAVKGSYKDSVALTAEVVHGLTEMFSQNDVEWLVTADHGEGLKEHGIRTHERGLYDSLVHDVMYTSKPVTLTGMYQHSDIPDLSDTLRCSGNDSASLPFRDGKDVVYFQGIGTASKAERLLDGAIVYSDPIAFRGLRTLDGLKVIETVKDGQSEFEAYATTSDPSETCNIVESLDTATLLEDAPPTPEPPEVLDGGEWMYG